VAADIAVQFQLLHKLPFQAVQFITPLQYLSKVSPAVPEPQAVQLKELQMELFVDKQFQPPEQK
jgi:hypothetical protein